jgi:hypothetical protein
MSFASRQHSPLLAVVAGLMMVWSNNLCGCAMLRSSSAVPQEKVTHTTASEDSSVTQSTLKLESEAKTAKSSAFSSSKRVALTYVAHMPEGGVFISNSAIQQAGGNDENTADLVGQQWAMAELRIDLPHPDGRTDVGRATVELKPLSCGERCDSKSLSEVRSDRQSERQSRYSMWVNRWLWRAKPQGVELPPNAVATLDLPRSEIEQILTHLEKQGHFRRNAENQGPARLDVLCNQRKITHACGYDEVLDKLVCEVWARGHQELATRRREQQELQLTGYEVEKPARTAARSTEPRLQR